MPERPGPLLDRRGRRLGDLRISVTDRCNFRCGYCMPREHFGPEHRFLPRAELLTFEEIARFARVATDLGVSKVRLTGGEPLLRKSLPELVRLLSMSPGIDLALTTNGALLAGQAGELARAGLARVTVSLDALDPAAFRALSDSDFEVSTVLEGIDAAATAGLGPIKINSVIRRGVNESQIVPLARKFRGTGHVVRFIEYMDVGVTNDWRLEQVVSGREIVECITREFPLEPLEAAAPGEVARRFRYADGAGEIGIITSVTQSFCGGCTRLRLSSEGQLYTCLFATRGRDIRAVLRGGATDAELARIVSELWHGRDDRYSELRAEPKRRLPRIEMSYIGG